MPTEYRTLALSIAAAHITALWVAFGSANVYTECVSEFTTILSAHGSAIVAAVSESLCAAYPATSWKTHNTAHKNAFLTAN